jgi:hypothetical protein
MQFLENSVLGLRTARHVLRSPEMEVAITLYPMVHLGEAGFYDAVYAQALDHDLCLYEGVTSDRVTNLTRSYRWMGVARMGLVVQPKLPTSGGRAQRVLADMPTEVFDHHWAQLPRGMRALISVGAPVVGVIRGLRMTRARLAKGMNQDDLTSRKDLLAWSQTTSDFLGLIRDKRDAYLTGCLSEHLAKADGEPCSIAVIYGAAHMPVVTRFLAEHG